tara:strand:- start:232 stop:600 length:369 start_codon:yes stop_codon:yes gene_type:complete
MQKQVRTQTGIKNKIMGYTEGWRLNARDLEEERNDLDYANSQPNENELDYTEIQKAKNILIKHKYYVDNLWCVDDVKRLLEDQEFTDEQAMQVLEKVFDSDRINNEVWESIRWIAQDMGYKV